jgi:hypothetical protein
VGREESAGGPGRRAALRGLLALALAGCGVLGPRKLDVPPGQRVAIGRVDLTRFDVEEVILFLTRDDGVFGDQMNARGLQDFVVTLPPGRYEIRKLHTVNDRLSIPDHASRRVQVSFEIPDSPVVYLGTLRLSTRIPPFVESAVIDEFDRTVPRFRARYPDLPEPVRSLFVASPSR